MFLGYRQVRYRIDGWDCRLGGHVLDRKSLLAYTLARNP